MPIDLFQYELYWNGSIDIEFSDFPWFQRFISVPGYYDIFSSHYYLSWIQIYSSNPWGLYDVQVLVQVLVFLRIEISLADGQLWFSSSSLIQIIFLTSFDKAIPFKDERKPIKSLLPIKSSHLTLWKTDWPETDYEIG